MVEPSAASPYTQLGRAGRQAYLRWALSALVGRGLLRTSSRGYHPGETTNGEGYRDEAKRDDALGELEQLVVDFVARNPGASLAAIEVGLRDELRRAVSASLHRRGLALRFSSVSHWVLRPLGALAWAAAFFCLGIAPDLALLLGGVGLVLFFFGYTGRPRVVIVRRNWQEEGEDLPLTMFGGVEEPFTIWHWLPQLALLAALGFGVQKAERLGDVQTKQGQVVGMRYFSAPMTDRKGRPKSSLEDGCEALVGVDERDARPFDCQGLSRGMKVEIDYVKGWLSGIEYPVAVRPR